MKVTTILIIGLPIAAIRHNDWFSIRIHDEKQNCSNGIVNSI